MSRHHPPDHRGPDAVAGLRMRLRRREEANAIPALPRPPLDFWQVVELATARELRRRGLTA